MNKQFKTYKIGNSKMPKIHKISNLMKHIDEQGFDMTSMIIDMAS